MELRCRGVSAGVWHAQPFLEAKLLQNMGKTAKASLALKAVCRLRNECVPFELKCGDLKMDDFDNLVTFWSR